MFIKLTTTDGRPCYVESSSIVTVRENSSGDANIFLNGNGAILRVLETAHEIVRMVTPTKTKTGKKSK